ncbi:MAG: hypothetical protein ACLFSU_04330 [Acholeplasmataceae bacterium]
MATSKTQLIIHYIEKPEPVISFGFFERNKKEVIRHLHDHIQLESYQVDHGKLRDEVVLAERIMNLSEDIDGKIKDGIHFIVDSPRVLYYSMILPRMSIKKAKQMAFKELEETFINYGEEYSVRSYAVDAKEKGIFVYFELLPLDIIRSFTNMSEHIDKYVDSVNLGNIALLNYFNASNVEQDDVIVIYGDEHLTLVGLIIGRQLVETQAYYQALKNDETLFTRIGLGIKVMSGKHEFHFERTCVKHVLVFVDDQEVKSSLERYLNVEYDLDRIETDHDEFVDMLHIFFSNDDFVDYVFKLDV